MSRIIIFLFSIILLSCSQFNKQKKENTLFKRLFSNETGLRFENTLLPKKDFDVFRYRNYYNGGGVAIGDINNDGLPDVYLTSNMGDNKLFLNKGGFTFEDITEKAGVAGSRFWSTGVSMADVNGDGLLDIYVCNSGDIEGDNRDNELFINHGNLTFSENATQFGLADKGFSTHAAFFDYDKDGDLDCYLLNNSFKPISSLGYRNLRKERDPLGGHKLYRNDDGKFNDVSEQAGIFGSVIGFGLGVTVGDLNQDNWPDLYVSNDFYERDYLYINNHDGTFKEKLEEYIGHLSMFSMGADLADLNNDGYPEIFSTDMLPEDDSRLKTMTAFETYDVYQLRLKNGYYHQFMRNMLQLNNQDGTFMEVGQLAGVSATDWSWGALLADFDNDTRKEILVCNGIYKDVTNQDFVEFLGSSVRIQDAIQGKKMDYQDFVDRMPSQKLSNYLYVQDSAFHFTNQSVAWGLSEPSFSNGAAYGDLDNDGDLDLIINNVNQEAFVYKNQSNELTSNNFLALTFSSTTKNTFGVGGSVKAFIGDELLFMEHMPIRGFQSSMDYKMIVGLGRHNQVDSLVVIWPDDKMQILKNVKASQTLALVHAQASETFHQKYSVDNTLLQEVKSTEIIHHENDFNDFDRDRLLYHMLSTQGPAFARADLNDDGLDDFYLGGAVGKPGTVYMQRQGLKFMMLSNEMFKADSLAEDVDAVFFDADGDLDLDLYVVSGGSENVVPSRNIIDRLYINKSGRHELPVFEKVEGKLPLLYHSGSCVRPVDMDKDGDLDLFVGTRSSPSSYGLPCDQHILLNDGKGNFSNASATIAPQLSKLGMVTDATWFDYDHNGYPDLIMVGDWMPITIFQNDGQHLTKVENIKGLEKSEGWWNSIKMDDLDQDGDSDFVLGNLGSNSKFKPTAESPITLYVNDFDQNGSMEPIFTFSKDQLEYPLVLRQDIIKQMSSMKKKFVQYKDFADKSIKEIFDQSLLEQATILKFFEPRTSVLLNNGSNGFQLKPLPMKAQVSPVFGIEVSDFNKDNHPDIVLSGNLFAVKPEVGRYDALQGLVLLGNGKGDFTPISSIHSGLKIEGEVRHIEVLRAKDKSLITFVRNNDSIKFYEIK